MVNLDMLPTPTHSTHRLTWMALAVFAALSSAAPASAVPSVAEQFPRDKLAEVLLPIQDWRPFPVCVVLRVVPTLTNR